MSDANKKPAEYLLSFQEGKTLDCRFLVPCDEEQVVLALERAGHAEGKGEGGFHDYSHGELLRKFFDVIVRMDPPLPSDMTDYAAAMADRIGLDRSLAMGVVDAANATNPRLAKKLLNSLKLTQERIRLAQAAGELPPSESVRDLNEATVAVVVLRETVPCVVAVEMRHPGTVAKLQNAEDGRTVLENLQKHDSGLPESVTRAAFAKASAVLKRCQPLSTTLAGLLLTMHWERDAEGIANPLAVRLALDEGDASALASLLCEGSAEERRAMVAYIAARCVEDRTSERLMARLRLAVALHRDHRGQEGIRDAVHGLLIAAVDTRVRSLLPRAVRLGSELVSLAEATLGLPDTARAPLDDAVFSNYRKLGGKPRAAENEDELRYLLVVANRLCPTGGPGPAREMLQGDLSALLTEEAKDPRKLGEFVAWLEGLLPADTTTVKGMLPSLGLALLSVSSQGRGGSQGEIHQRRYRLAGTLIGDDTQVSVNALRQLLGEGSAEPSGKQEAGQEFWTLVGALLANVPEPEAPQFAGGFVQRLGILEIGDECGWLAAYRPVLLRFSEDVIKKAGTAVGQAMVTVVQGNQRGFTDNWRWVLAESIAGRPSSELEVPRWETLCLSVLDVLRRRALECSGFPDGIRKALETVHALRWPAVSFADEILARKILGDQGPCKPWLNTLAPMCGGDVPKLHARIVENLQNGRQLPDSLAAGFALVWRDEMGQDDARCLGSALCGAHGNAVAAVVSQHMEKLAQLRGGPAAMKVAADQMYDQATQEWIEQHRQAAALILQQSGNLEVELQCDLQRRCVRLLNASADEGQTLRTLDLLASIERLGADLNSTFQELARSRKPSIAGKAKELLKKSRLH